MEEAKIENKEMEAEIQTRVEFKMNEFLTAVKNSCTRNWQFAFSTMNPKYQHYWEAFEEMQKMFEKEIRMPVPYDEMDKKKKWEAKEKAVENISHRFNLRGSRDGQILTRFLVSEIEKAQNF